MTWRLYFYDHDDVEIGYVEKPDKQTYNVVITHPESGWNGLRSELRYYEGIEETMEDYSELEQPGWRWDHGPMTYRAEPEDHLRIVQERFSRDSVAYTELRDV